MSDSTALTVPTGPDADTIGTMALTNPTALKAQLDGYTAARKLFVDWLFSALTAGTDYMLIHRKIGRKPNQTDCPYKDDRTSRRCTDGPKGRGCGSKASLCKPGSEKICGLLRLRPTFRRDLDTWEMLGKPAGTIALVCELLNTEERIVAEGRGVRDQQLDWGDVNKTIKMVQKSAQTDAVLRCAGLSEVFTLDLEDMRGAGNVEDENGGGPPPIATPRRREASKGGENLESGAVDGGGDRGGGAPRRLGGDRPLRSRGPETAAVPENPGLFDDDDPAGTLREANAQTRRPQRDGSPEPEYTAYPDGHAPASATGLIGPTDIAHLMAHARRHQVTEDVLDIYLLTRFGIDSKKKIGRVLFPAILEWIERQGGNEPPPRSAAKFVRTRR